MSEQAETGTHLSQKEALEQQVNEEASGEGALEIAEVEEGDGPYDR